MVFQAQPKSNIYSRFQRFNKSNWHGRVHRENCTDPDQIELEPSSPDPDQVELEPTSQDVDSQPLPGCSHWSDRVPDSTELNLGEYNGVTDDTNLKDFSFFAGADDDDSGDIQRPRCLRPRPTTEETPLQYSSDENIVVNMGQLELLIHEVQQHTCRHPNNVKLEMTKRHGLCITTRLRCNSCRNSSEPIDLFSQVTTKPKKGPTAGELNEGLLLPVLKSKCGVGDVRMVLACLNIKPPSKTMMHRKFNKTSDTMVTVNEERMQETRQQVSLI